ncbi:MAG TPA: histidine kinase [Terriglobales bacterium]
MDSKLILITLLIRLGVAAAIASGIVRSRFFKSILFREERSIAQTVQLVLIIGIPFALGVWIRASVRSFVAADVSFEGVILMGVMGGRFGGILGGLLCAAPALFHHEWLALPMDLLAGYVAGIFRGLAPNREDIWSFSPMVDLSIYRWIRRNFPVPRYDWQVAFFIGILILQLAREMVGKTFPGRLFYFYSPSLYVQIAIFAASVAAIAIPIKIWNATRIEIKLEEQARLLLQARLDALQSQINPHFLFNTLNSIASLVRFKPDEARDLVVKLGNILRALLRKHDAFVRLRDEVEFIDNYLDIEVVRFGEKLRVIKDLDAETLDAIIPSMLLQPLVENSIKHGITPKIEGGSIVLRSRLKNGKIVIEIEDDGVGMLAEDGMAALQRGRNSQKITDDTEWVQLSGGGIGMHNVAERLSVLYGENARIEISSRKGCGTRITLDLPMLQAHSDSPSAASAIYEARSSTRV